jgi:hypothetical protein
MSGNYEYRRKPMNTRVLAIALGMVASAGCAGKPAGGAAHPVEDAKVSLPNGWQLKAGLSRSDLYKTAEALHTPASESEHEEFIQGARQLEFVELTRSASGTWSVKAADKPTPWPQFRSTRSPPGLHSRTWPILSRVAGRR